MPPTSKNALANSKEDSAIHSYAYQVCDILEDRLTRLDYAFHILVYGVDDKGYSRIYSLYHRKV